MIKLVFVSILTYACILEDMREGVISNKITLPGIFMGSLCLLWDKGIPGIVSWMKGVFASFLISLLLFRTGVIGGGDGKFFMAGASVYGFPGCIKIFFLSFFCCAIQLLIDGVIEGRLKEVFKSTFHVMIGKRHGAEPILFSHSIGIGLLAGGAG